jgi:lipoic acid synthetase
MMRLPGWIKARHSPSELRGLKSRLRGHGLVTVCEEARCPNKAACFAKPTAAFMLLGSSCTRGCGFCSVSHGRPLPPDPEEPRRVAEAAHEMALSYVVLTSVTRDDLPDGGASHFAATIRAVREALPGARVEVLTPDFKGDPGALGTVLGAVPDVFNHNVETVPRLYPEVRPRADYRRSVGLLARAARMAPSIRTKSGLMLGLGEGFEEVLGVMDDLRGAGCSMLTIGQYLRPGRRNLPVHSYVEPRVFERLGREARERGFEFVASAPMVRSSMNAEELYENKMQGCN